MCIRGTALGPEIGDALDRWPGAARDQIEGLVLLFHPERPLDVYALAEHRGDLALAILSLPDAVQHLRDRLGQRPADQVNDVTALDGRALTRIADGHDLHPGSLPEMEQLVPLPHA